MNIKSAVERSKRKRALSRNAGINDKRVSLRTDEDARELDELLQKQLTRFVKVHLSGADEMNAFSPQVREALEQVLLLQGSPEYITPHGAFSTFLTTLLENGMTSEVAPAVAIYTEVYPSSLDYVLKSLPAKAINNLCRTANSQDVIKWKEENPGWQERLIYSVKDGTFAAFLRQVRESIGAANINYRFLMMLEHLCQDAGELSEEIQQQAKDILAQAPETLVLSPREWNENCNNLRRFILFFMMIDLQNRYGDRQSSDTTFMIPFYNRLREEHGVANSQVISFHPEHPLAKDYKYGVCIGWRYDSWEQFFYQIAHEAVHLLNPKVWPTGTLRTCALDEGMAVRYAEEMLEKYLPYVSRAFVDSPVGANTPYNYAWRAACKLPDTVLRQIRDEFGSFGEIGDAARFAEMTSQWLTPEEAGLLSGNFCYR